MASAVSMREACRLKSRFASFETRAKYGIRRRDGILLLVPFRLVRVTRGEFALKLAPYRRIQWNHVLTTTCGAGGMPGCETPNGVDDPRDKKAQPKNDLYKNGSFRYGLWFSGGTTGRA